MGPHLGQRKNHCGHRDRVRRPTQHTVRRHIAPDHPDATFAGCVIRIGIADESAIGARRWPENVASSATVTTRLSGTRFRAPTVPTRQDHAASGGPGTTPVETGCSVPAAASTVPWCGTRSCPPGYRTRPTGSSPQRRASCSPEQIHPSNCADDVCTIGRGHEGGRVN